MRRIVAGQAESELEAVIEAARIEPAEIVHEGVGAAIVLSPAMFQSLMLQARTVSRPELERLMKQSVDRFGQVYRSLAAWEAEHEPPDRDK